jgi:hypothetical protein
MAERLVWARVMRPRTPLVYLDFNHLIYLARVNSGEKPGPKGYRELFDAATLAVSEGRAVFPLSAEHLWEMGGVRDPRQRKHLADVMEELSGFQYMLGRCEIAQLEIDAGLEDIFGETPPPIPLPLIRPTFGWAFGMRGGLSLRDQDGGDASAAVRKQMGIEYHDRIMRTANYVMERGMLEGPGDEEIPILREKYGYAPERARKTHESRLAFELDLTQRLAEEPKWRRGRLRDVVSAREFAHEWLDVITRANLERIRQERPALKLDDDEGRRFMAAMPHTQVAITIKTRYHRDPGHKWTVNDITDIDAISVAYAYCDALFTDRAIRAALANAKELRKFATFLPRTPSELTDWLNQQPAMVAPDLLVPHPRGAEPQSSGV